MDVVELAEKLHGLTHAESAAQEGAGLLLRWHDIDPACVIVSAGAIRLGERHRRKTARGKSGIDNPAGGLDIGREHVAARLIDAVLGEEGRLGEIAVDRADRLHLLVVDRPEQIESVAPQVSGAPRQCILLLAAAKRPGRIVERHYLATAVVCPRDEIDDAADRVRAVDGGRAVEQNLDALDGRQRDRVQIHASAVERVIGYATPVQQYERVAPAEAAQRRSRETRLARVSQRLSRAVAAHVAADPVHEVRSGCHTGPFDFVSRDRLDGRNPFGLGARDVRSGDDHACGLFLLRGRVRRQRNTQSRAQRDR